MNNKTKGILILTVVAIFSITTLAFAGWGRGYGHMMGPGNWGPDWHSGYGYGQRGYYDNQSEEEIAKLDKQRDEYFKATENLSQELYAKQLELRSELAKENPDTGEASKLQRDISTLQGKLDQERLNFEIKAKNFAPNYDRDFGGYGPMMGYGPEGYGHMMGYGPRGGGYCMW
jgi:zinc resistance-associated protein